MREQMILLGNNPSVGKVEASRLNALKSTGPKKQQRVRQTAERTRSGAGLPIRHADGLLIEKNEDDTLVNSTGHCGTNCKPVGLRT
jgi:hypothetical protein